ncbi:MAG: galactose-1-phosphate uridylyltransferase [Promethearchaeota archaeon]
MKNKNELRWDPILEQWVIVAKNRTNRPVLGKVFSKSKPNNNKNNEKYQCPFCPDAPEGAGDWMVKAVPNKYPSLVNGADISFNNEFIQNDFYKMRPGKGICEVFLYSQNHNKTLGDLSLQNIEALIELWKKRFSSSMKDPELKYSFIMENRGKVIGVSLSHPHGQMYSFPFIPPKILKEINSSKTYWEKEHKCLFCKIIETEKKAESRIVEENDDFISFIPYFAKWPFEIHIFPKNHVPHIIDINKKNNNNFARIIKSVVLRLDGLYGFVMPYVMAHHNAPYNSGNINFFHYHIEIYPPYRAKNRIKYLAGVELGTNTVINTSNPSNNAKLLRKIKIDLRD